MKKIITFFFLGVLSMSIVAKAELFGNSSQKIEALTSRIDSLSQTVSYLKTELGNKDVRIHNLETIVKGLQSEKDNLQKEVSETKSSINTAITQLNNQLGNKIETAEASIETNKKATDSSIKRILSILVSGLAVLLAIAGFIYWVLRKRIGKGSDDIKTIKDENKKLEEQSVVLDTKLAELLERQLKTDQNLQSISLSSIAEADHTLALSVANEMSRIEQNLSFMDPKTKGVSQLRNRAAAIAATLKDKGYEIPNLIGSEYKEGDNMDVVMEEDEDLEPGKMIIRRVNRPCVLFKGKMIQCAKAVVAYNPE